MLDYSSLNDIFQELDPDRSASAAHGLLCGLLCTDTAERAKAKWFTEILTAFQENPELIGGHADQLRELDALFSETLEQLNAPMFEFQLLLPAEDEKMVDRVRALAVWCGAYSFGFSLGANSISANKHGEAGKKESRQGKHSPGEAGQKKNGERVSRQTETTRPSRNLPDDTLELLEDFQAIARSETDSAMKPVDLEGDATEKDYLELEEYVRVGVVYINEELQSPVKVAPNSHKPGSLH